MTDHDPLDDLASAHLDGVTTPEEAARVAADPELVARVEALRAVRAAVASSPAADPDRREQAIAAGRLDNPIDSRGRGETAQLLRALGTMQASIAAALARIQALMREQELSHAGQLAAQHARLDAALSNMNQGLCLFGTDGRLAVANRRFAELFGAPELGALPEQMMHEGRLQALMIGCQGGEAASFSCDLPDGRSIAVSHRPMTGGGWVATYEDITERRAAEARLVHMAPHDALTGLPNRLLFREHTHRALARLRRGGGGLAVLCLDLDRFKAVNDALGHVVGDAVLRAVRRA